MKRTFSISDAIQEIIALNISKACQFMQVSGHRLFLARGCQTVALCSFIIRNNCNSET